VDDHNLNLVKEQLCPTGTLRAAINMTNALLVSGTTTSGDPTGVSPDLAAAIANKLSVPLVLLSYPGPGHVADAMADGAWDIGNIAAEPERAKTIWFSPAYCEIQATYLVRSDAGYSSAHDIDKPGVRIAAKSRAAYELWLRENLKHATLETADSFEASVDRFMDESLDALAGLRPALLAEQSARPGTQLIDDSFTAVQQCIGCRPGLAQASAWLTDFVQQQIANGEIQNLIDKHGVTGRLSVSSLSD